MGSPAAIVYAPFRLWRNLGAHIELVQVMVPASLGECHVLEKLWVVDAELPSQDLPQSGKETHFFHSVIEYTDIVDV